MAESVSTNNPRKSRKRKADQAQIDEPQDLKRLKIQTPEKAARPQSVISNEKNDASNDTEVSAFDAMLNASDSDIPEATPTDDKMVDQIPETIIEETSKQSNVSNASNSSNTNSNSSSSTQSVEPKQPSEPVSSPSKDTESTNDSKPSEFQWGDNAITGFGSFGASDDGNVGFGAFGKNQENKDTNKLDTAGSARSGGWGTPRDFVFTEDSSTFSFKEMAKEPSPQKKGEEFGFPSNFGAEPVAKLAGKEVDTGDKEDENLFTIKGRIYELNMELNKYEEKGIGMVKLNVYGRVQSVDDAEDREKVKARLLCRREVTLKTIMNAVLTKETTFTKMTAKSVRFTVFEQQVGDKEEDDADLEVVTKTYLLKSMETETKLDELITEIGKIQEKM